jgi:hypothetical protein
METGRRCLTWTVYVLSLPRFSFDGSSLFSTQLDNAPAAPPVAANSNSTQVLDQLVPDSTQDFPAWDHLAADQSLADWYLAEMKKGVSSCLRFVLNLSVPSHARFTQAFDSFTYLAPPSELAPSPVATTSTAPAPVNPADSLDNHVAEGSSDNFFTYDWASLQDLAGTEEFLQWYTDELARGVSCFILCSTFQSDGPSVLQTFDAVDYSSLDQGVPVSNTSRQPVVPVTVNPYDIFRPLSSPTDHVEPPASVCSSSRLLAGSHVLLQPVFDPRFLPVNNRAVVHVPVESTTTVHTDSADLHDVTLMTDGSSDGTYATTDDDEEEEDDADYLEPEDIRRHYWRNGNLYYGYVGYTITALHDVTLTMSQFQFR